MKKYQIIPRKFRPKRFSEVVGQEAIVTTLKNALLHQRIAQAYLFCGARGCGKTTLARLFAKSLNCSTLEENEPCNRCDSCQEIAEGRSLDVIEIDGASNRGIDDIRQINETVGYAPSKGNYKIYIIDEVHMLTKEAFNALLKTLEEPPPLVKFFFATTEPHKLPTTIISRCQRFNLGRIPEKALAEKLKRICSDLGVQADEEALLQISKLSEGSLRDAESLLDQLICFGKTPITLDLTRLVFGLITHDLLSKLDEAIHTQNLNLAVELALEFYESGRDINASIDSLFEHFRIYLLIALGKPAQGYYKKWAARYPRDLCLLILDKLIQWQQSLIKTPFKQIHLEMLLLDLSRSSVKIPLETLVERLIELEARLKNTSCIEQAEPVQEIAGPSNQELFLEEDPPLDSLESLVPYEEPVKEEIYKEIENTRVDVQTIASETKIEKSKSPTQHLSKYDTLIRFAAVELEGTVNRS